MAPVIPKTHLENFRLRLAETIVWCASHANAGEPKVCLRSQALQPHLLAGCRKEMVASVTLHRQWQLHKPSLEMASNLADGRLVYYLPNDSVVDGASEAASSGYFDCYDTPPWDTWVWYVHPPEGIQRRGQRRDSRVAADYLIAWVPPTMTTLVNEGIITNAIDCIGWLENLQSPIVVELARAGLLPRPSG